MLLIQWHLYMLCSSRILPFQVYFLQSGQVVRIHIFNKIIYLLSENKLKKKKPSLRTLILKNNGLSNADASFAIALGSFKFLGCKGCLIGNVLPWMIKGKKAFI